MGLLDRWLPKHAVQQAKTATAPGYKTITEYAPVFSTWDGKLYEKALTRAAVEKTAVLASKLKPEVLGSAKPRIAKAINTTPNQYMSWPKMIGRLMTILLNENTAAVVPVLDDKMNVTGLFPLKFDHAEIVDYADEPWIRFYVPSGDTLAIELRNVCLLTRFHYESEFFGSSNQPLSETLRLMDFQDQAQEQAIKNGAKIQFIAAAGTTLRPEDMEAKRRKFSEDNLSAKNTTGLMIYDNTFDSMKQVEPMSYTVSTEEMQRIEANVYNYFGINADILQSNYSEEQFGAFYESQIEPFAVQLGEGLTQMLYTQRERSEGNKITFSANRLEYASNASKRNMIRDMMDRGVMTWNEAREILQLPPVSGGDVFMMRGEYVMMDKDGNVLVQSGGVQTADGATKKDHLLQQPGSTLGDGDSDPGSDDDIYNDNDTKGAKEVDW